MSMSDGHGSSRIKQPSRVRKLRCFYPSAIETIQKHPPWQQLNHAAPSACKANNTDTRQPPFSSGATTQLAPFMVDSWSSHVTVEPLCPTHPSWHRATQIPPLHIPLRA